MAEINYTSSSKKIAKNTLFLYFRMLLTMGVGLYTVRIVLNTLGVVDYGVFHVVGGIVTFFSFMNGSMASASQRFFSFEIGRNDVENLKKTFTVNWIIYGLIALIVFVLLETAGLWFVNNHLNMPPSRYNAAQWLYQLSILSFMVSILVTPFMSMIIAHEDLHIYAYVSIIEALSKLGIVSLLVVLPWDKLIVYGILLCAMSFINSSIYIIVCMKKYEECQFHKFYWDRNIFKEVIGFTGWTLFGQFTTITRKQAVTILINQLFNPVVVAAMSISTQTTNYVTIFSNNFNVSLYPPIIKNYASGQKDQMLNLMFNGSKICFFLMWVFAAPLFLGMDEIMRLWLKNPPPYTVLFSRLALIEVLINSTSFPLMTMARAAGKMKLYELTLGSIQLSIFFMSWFSLSLGAPVYSVLLIAIIINCIMFVARIFLVKHLINYSILQYFKKVIFPVSAVILISINLSAMVFYLLPKGFAYLNVSILLSVIISSTCMYLIGLEHIERIKIRAVVENKIFNFLRLT